MGLKNFRDEIYILNTHIFLSEICSCLSENCNLLPFTILTHDASEGQETAIFRQTCSQR